MVWEHRAGKKRRERILQHQNSQNRSPVITSVLSGRFISEDALAELRRLNRLHSAPTTENKTQLAPKLIDLTAPTPVIDLTTEDPPASDFDEITARFDSIESFVKRTYATLPEST